MSNNRKVNMRLDPSFYFYRQLINGIARYSRLNGHWIFYTEPSNYISFKTEQSWNPDGCIVRISNVKVAKEYIALGVPVIAIPTSQYIPGLPTITTDDDAIGKMAAEHLLNLGFKNFAYCGFSDRVFWSKQRSQSFKKAVAQSGFGTIVYKKASSSRKYGRKREEPAMVNWLKSLPKPTGLMTCRDILARDVIENCKVAGLKVPEEIAIIGVDNDDVFCNVSHPPLSSIALNLEKAGYDAAELLDKLMSRKKPKKQTIIVRPTHVVTRQSTDILAVSDHEVAMTVRFIRQNSKRSLSVEEVVDKTYLSKRTLQRRFHKVLGRSVYKEIRRSRIAVIKQMLLETNLTISQIALKLGYNGDNHISRFFRKDMGMTPLEYRKKFIAK